ncbi:MAG: class B sortase [Clostridia bacterium]|nr:class B sortase [Clostridia bacterium]
MEKKKKEKKYLMIVLVSIILICIMVCIGKFIYNKMNSDKDILGEMEIDKSQITNEKPERILQLEELQKENQDIIAYLQIEGTNISYPVVQTDNNDFYMKHDYKKEYSSDGSLFLDKDYDWTIPSSNLLIYGHNNKNGKMFAELMNYKEEKFYQEHPKIIFTTNSEDKEYEIIAVFLSRVYYKSEKNVFRYYYFINAQTEEEYNDYIENSKKASLYDTGKSAEYGEQLITLSTCSYHTEDGRLAVVAKKIK